MSKLYRVILWRVTLLAVPLFVWLMIMRHVNGPIWSKMSLLLFSCMTVAIIVVTRLIFGMQGHDDAIKLFENGFGLAFGVFAFGWLMTGFAPVNFRGFVIMAISFLPITYRLARDVQSMIKRSSFIQNVIFAE